ncbi:MULTISPECIES: hemin-degrading factor [Lonsdalea]|uniref:Hemin transporter n=2 Tax=Lonsdalea TaxID=1082702 RepID=A0ACD1JD28_9GAMM|nr:MULTISPECIES: ChuX/HutX family heme-like substrate-binding protein [Lonsdalea]RAT13917.1 hemin transporter [Lonsdalea quercina]RAT19170.1 hemin transporter [Lonsdalea populi]RAT22001.1 hemin transporter [Lonsdalea populi]RAT24829.1 hemin transporter [Lonsdalea populi]RAT34945.1 hemin transporter [Lonsdalea populi]
MKYDYQHYLQLKEQHPKKYARELAQLMNISEAELSYLRVGHEARRLIDEPRHILAALEGVGETKSITRNEYAVHEQIGFYRNQRIGGHAGVVLNPRGLDLRVFPEQWASVFFFIEQTARGERQSIQFYDRQGDAVLKVYGTEHTDWTAWQEMVERFTASDNAPLALTPYYSPASDVVVDAARLEQAWREMQDVHEFFPLLKRHNLTRQQAFRHVSDDLACRVDNQALATLLNAAHQDGNEIMIFVGNRGCVQIFTGVIEKVVPMDHWLNVFNAAFTLHLQGNTIAESWVTRKPTRDGVVTSLELFAADGTQIAQLFGQRTEGQPEQVQWRRQVSSLMTPGAVA